MAQVKITPAIARKISKLRASGESLRGIAALLLVDGVSLSPPAIRDALLREQVKEGAKAAAAAKRGQVQGGDGAGEGEGSGPGTSTGGAEGGTGGGRGGVAGTDAGAPRPAGRSIPGLPELPDDASVAARVCWMQLSAALVDVARCRAKVASGELMPSQLGESRTAARRLTLDLAELLPPPRTDPAKDPTNIGAREMVHTTVLRKIEAAEARAGRLCVRCRAEVLGG